MKKIFFFICVVCVFVACKDDHSDVRPGLWTAQDMIETFPGDTVLVTGQVSNYIGLSSVSIDCDAWNIHQTYSLDGKHAKVYDFNYRLPVPADAQFDQVLRITVTDTEGTENKKTIPLVFLPDTGAPEDLSDMVWQVAVDFDPVTGSAVYPLAIPVSDSRGLKQATLSIASLDYTETIALNGKNDVIRKDLVLPSVGNYDMQIIIENVSGNKTEVWHQFVVMLAEEEDPISDYTLMWVVNASENAEDYLDGYYSPMSRKDAYQYEGKIYADHDGYQLYIVPTKTMDGDIFGSSPYVSSKLMNKRDYVVPVTVPTAGYYGIWIDIQAHTYSLWALDTSASYTGSLTFSGCGFNDFGDWGTPGTEMTRNGFRYTQTVNQNGAYAGTRQYYAARVSDWGYILRYWSDPVYGCGWWEDTAGGGGSVGSYTSDYDGPVEVTFDTAILWGTVKKVNN